jgi:septum formation protein
MSHPPGQPPLILASGSPRRKELLARLGVEFTVVVAQVEEYEETTADPRALVGHNAALKTGWVAERNPGVLVLGADTTVALGDVVLNKPVDLDHARSMLAQLAGRTHTVYTGVCVRGPGAGTGIDEVVTSEVTFKPLGPREIDDYLGLVHTLDKAGAYSVQDHTELIVAGYRGSFSNIMGLPLESTKQILTRCGLLG